MRKNIFKIEIDTIDLTIREISANEMEDFKKFAEKRIANFLLESGFLDDLVSSFKSRDKL